MNKEKEVLAVIADILNVEAEKITAESRVEEFVEWDSLAHVMIIGALDEKFGIYIDLEQALEIESVGQILKLCQ